MENRYCLWNQTPMCLSQTSSYNYSEDGYLARTYALVCWASILKSFQKETTALLTSATAKWITIDCRSVNANNNWGLADIIQITSGDTSYRLHSGELLLHKAKICMKPKRLWKLYSHLYYHFFIQAVHLYLFHRPPKYN